MDEQPTLYEMLLNAGCEIANYHSDMHVKVTADSTRIIREYKRREGMYKPEQVPDAWVTTFKSNEDGSRWYDIPMMYDPYWLAREAQRRH